MEQQNPQPQVPCLPESAPFTPEQRAYLNGFLAGLFSRAPVPAGAVASAASVETLTPLSILFGSQTGNAENLAKRVAREAGRRGFAPTVHDLSKYPIAQLASEKRLLVVTSTFGEGEPPDNAKAFWDFLCSAAAPRLPHLRFSVCALGDSNYAKFCGFGKDVDTRFEALGAQRQHPWAACDVEFEEPFTKWLNGALGALASLPTGVRPSPGAAELESREALGGSSALTVSSLAAPGDGRTPAVSGSQKQENHSRKNPFPASLITNRRLNGPGSAKDTRHFEISLDGSDLAYETGDALGVVPSNCPELVEDILSALKCSGEEAVPGRDGVQIVLRDALQSHYEITKISHAFLRAMAERSNDEALRKLAMPGVNGELTSFLWGREIIDLLLAHPGAGFTPAEFVNLLKKLQPRLYSIASSSKAHPGQVHLTVSIVRYTSLSRSRKGVCSTFLAERLAPSRPVPVFVHTSQNFRLPPNRSTPMIMIGPGTGIAPFRAFLQERRAIGATGKNWLFFGDQHASADFMYRDELEAMLGERVLTRLDTAFSRDQERKLYVQHRMQEHDKELFDWLEQGAHFYVCGDASRMAKDVEAALHHLIQTGGGRTPEQASEYVHHLKATKRYQRDVY